VSLLYSLEEGGDIFLRNIVLVPNFTTLHSLEDCIYENEVLIQHLIPWNRVLLEKLIVV
jgi:hypothetical protein